MSRPILQIATIEFLPYPVQGEFAIVGVAAVSDGGALLRKILPPTATERLIRFFPEIAATVFEQSLEGIENELADLERAHAADAAALYRALTTPREGMVRITARGTGVVEGPLDAWLEATYDRFVLRRRPEAAARL